MTNETPRWHALLDQLGADQIDEIRKLDISRKLFIMRAGTDGDLEPAQEWEAKLFEMAETGALLKRLGDDAFVGVPLPADAVSVDMPVLLPEENEDGPCDGGWVRWFTGSAFGDDYTFVVTIMGYQRADGTVERSVATTVVDGFIPQVGDCRYTEQVGDADTARERARLIIAACDEIDRLTLEELRVGR